MAAGTRGNAGESARSPGSWPPSPRSGYRPPAPGADGACRVDPAGRAARRGRWRPPKRCLHHRRPPGSKTPGRRERGASGDRARAASGSIEQPPSFPGRQRGRPRRIGDCRRRARPPVHGAVGHIASSGPRGATTGPALLRGLLALLVGAGVLMPGFCVGVSTGSVRRIAIGCGTRRASGPGDVPSSRHGHGVSAGPSGDQAIVL